ncbi:MAG: 50S ribosomal protein L11 methyltransferase [Cyclobacteriaceae bacterium]|nr:50S ribosomal protein L11 methyltransferase [Cyclobacteriaceae bacterium]
MNYIAVHLHCSPELAEILMAELALLPYDTFEEHETGISGYIDVSLFDEHALLQVIDKYLPLGSIEIEKEEIERINWNEEWEKNYDPVRVDDQVIIKAIFHDISEKYPYEIVIHPKMSFGTGHHSTTYLMIRQQLKIDHKGKMVYDFGSGTGVLAIMAAKLGASKVVATDVDDWCIENSTENFSLNHIDVSVRKGPVATLGLQEKAGIILANINKNVLIDEMAHYNALLLADGYLLLSGFYEQDIEDIKHKAGEFGLKMINRDSRQDWAVLVFHKPSL